MEKRKHIAFIHPDLGIGGAEQLVVNLCLAAIAHGLHPHIYTPYHHESFPQTHDGTITIHQHGSFFGLIPDTIAGKGKGVLAWIRCWVCVLWMALFASQDYECVVVDQVSGVLPLLRFFGFKTIFYCHYPDKLLAQSSKNPIKRVYRFFLDLMEEISIFFAQKIYVNSLYTQSVFYSSFPFLKRVQVQVLYPSIDLSKFDEVAQEDDETRKVKTELKDSQYIFSLNRYERKKNIELALQSFADLVWQGKSKGVKLVIAGGYDPKVRQNIEYHLELKQLAEKLAISEFLFFYTSISNSTRKYLLSNALCLLYTPTNEHFGIVPVQAMYLNVPVIADRSGGPLQSVGEGCGYLCKGKKEWVEKMAKIVGGTKLTEGRKRVIEKFGFQSFGKQFAQGIKQVVQGSKKL